MVSKSGILNELLIAVILTDKKGRIQWVNDDFNIITGYNLKEVKGKKPNILQGINTEPAVIKNIRECLTSLIPVRANITNYRKNGEEYLCKLVIYPIFNKNNEHTNYLAFEVDGDVIKDEGNVQLLQLLPKYPNTRLSSKKSLDIFVKLNKLFENEKIYLDPALKLNSLAKILNTNSRYLSQTLNKETGHNVLHFINKYRILEVKQLILSNKYQHLTTYGIAQKCGFRNKSTFYKVFKEFEGVTPKEFLLNFNNSKVTF